MKESREASRFWMVALVLGCVGAVVYFFQIWTAGFSMSEGHRVAPAWEMLSRGDWLLPHMFEQGYLRKPPGMPWAIAAMSWIFGESEWSARAVSGLAMIAGSMVSAWYARRWFGEKAALAAGLAHLLLPWMWESGRAAEIESLNNLGTVLAVWGMVDLLSVKGRTQAGSVVVMAMGLVIASLAKGPASLPVVAAVPVAACWVARGISGLKSRGFWIGLFIAALIAGVAGGLILRRLAMEASFVVTQGVDEFMWSSERVVKILALGGVFFVSALPMSLALIPALSARELGAERSGTARILAITVLLALAAYTFAGISNPRYTLPAAAVLSPLMGFAILTWELQAASTGVVGRLASVCARLAKPGAIALVIGAIGYAVVSEKRREESSGRRAGIALGELVEPDSTILANDMVEARPEVFLYAMQAAAQQKKNVRVRWLPRLSSMTLSDFPAADNVYVLVRTDAGSSELAAMKETGLLARLQLTAFHCEIGPENRQFTATLFRVRR